MVPLFIFGVTVHAAEGITTGMGVVSCTVGTCALIAALELLCMILLLRLLLQLCLLYRWCSVSEIYSLFQVLHAAWQGCFCICLWLMDILQCIGCGSSCGILTAANGTFSDGSDDDSHSNYDDNTSCQWLIAPDAATQITLNFTYFATEAAWDTVTMFKCSNIQCTSMRKLGHLSGSYTRSQTFVSETGYMLVDFSSDSTTTMSGFTAQWTSSNKPVGILSVSLLHCLPCMLNVKMHQRQGCIYVDLTVFVKYLHCVLAQLWIWRACIRMKRPTPSPTPVSSCLKSVIIVFITLPNQSAPCQMTILPETFKKSCISLCHTLWCMDACFSQILYLNVQRSGFCIQNLS